MKQILPIIVICSVGLAGCLGWLVYMLVQYFRKRRRRKVEEYDLDEKTLVINLDEKDFHK